MHEQLNSVGCVPFQTAEERRATEVSDVEWQLSSVSKAQTDRDEAQVQNDDHLQHIQVYMQIVYVNYVFNLSTIFPLCFWDSWHLGIMGTCLKFSVSYGIVILVLY